MAEQSERNRVITSFKKKEADILVATDVAARGLDIPHIRTVVNYDVARDIDTHTHRIGRTGRAGEKVQRNRKFELSELRRRWRVFIFGLFRAPPTRWSAARTRNSPATWCETWRAPISPCPSRSSSWPCRAPGSASRASSLAKVRISISFHSSSRTSATTSSIGE